MYFMDLREAEALSIFEMEQLACGEIVYGDLSVSQGEVVAIVGPSGCGKSTLLRLLNGTRNPTAGAIRYRGEPVADMDKAQLRRRVVLAGQSVFLFPGSVMDNMARFHAFHGSPVPSAEAVQGYLTLCGSPAGLCAPCESMSGGERQRIFLAIAVSMEPDVLLLDEPTSALDHTLARAMMTRLCQYAKKKEMTVLAVTHDEELARDLGDRVLRLGRGTV